MGAGIRGLFARGLLGESVVGTLGLFARGFLGEAIPPIITGVGGSIGITVSSIRIGL